MASAAAVAPHVKAGLPGSESQGGPADASLPSVGGPFELRQAISFYIVNQQGRDFTMHLRWSDEWQAEMDRPVMVRVFDPQENLIDRRLFAGERASGPPPRNHAELAVSARGAGVYQVVVHGLGGVLSVSAEPPLPWGVYGSPELGAHDSQFARSYLYLPAGLQRLGLKCQGDMEALQLVNEVGQLVAEAAGPNAAIQAAIPPGPSRVWRLSAIGRGSYVISSDGPPLILCPDRDVAESIHGSLEVLDDGAMCFHRFQARAHALLKRYREIDPAGFVVRAPVLSRFSQQWLADPARNSLLLGAYGVYSALPAVLEAQNLDPRSPWFGTIGAWRDATRRENPRNPWASADRLGLSRVADTAPVLAAVYSIDAPLNPLHRDPALLNRIIIAALQELMLLREHELPFEHFTNYAGGERAFTMPSFMLTFALVAQDCPQDVRDVWRDGLERYADRECLSAVPSVVNQWSAIIRGLGLFAQGAGDQWHHDMVARQIDWLLGRKFWARGWKPAGYFDEASGPDATYTGITLHALGCVFEDTKNPALREALRRCIDVFNHTIAPEPPPNAGVWLGSSNFCHRTPGDFSDVQWGGGFAMLADDIAEASPHVGRQWISPRLPRTPLALRDMAEALRPALRYLDVQALRKPELQGQIKGGPELFFPVWQHFADHPLDGLLPMVASEHFTRNFGDEFFAVRRPGYYALLYAGRPAGAGREAGGPADPSRQAPRNGGGLCMFWSPAFGCSILAKNWSAYAAHTLIARRGDETHCEDYGSVTCVFDQAAAAATVSGRLRDEPLAFRRGYQFQEDRLTCTLTLSSDAASQPLACDGLWECFPFPLDKPDPIRVSLLNADGGFVRDGPASAVVFRTGAEQCHMIVFDQPRICHVGFDAGIDVFGQPRRHGRVLTQLPVDWQPGQSRQFNWTMASVPVDGMQLHLRRLLEAMNPPMKAPHRQSLANGDPPSRALTLLVRRWRPDYSGGCPPDETPRAAEYPRSAARQPGSQLRTAP